MSLKILEEFANSPAPGFRCVAAGNESGPQFLARIRHVLHPAASSESIALARRSLGVYADETVAFYERHDGFVLYRDSLSNATGVELLPVTRWAKAMDDMRHLFEHLADNPEWDPDRILTGVAIATVPESANYFVMPVEGANAGRIFYADHDGWYESAFADNLDDFLMRVTRDPVRLLNDQLGCYTRFSDGTTALQWIPKEYFSDVSKAPL
jgi:hypothetical protein